MKRYYISLGNLRSLQSNNYEVDGDLLVVIHSFSHLLYGHFFHSLVHYDFDFIFHTMKL